MARERLLALHRKLLRELNRGHRASMNRAVYRRACQRPHRQYQEVEVRVDSREPTDYRPPYHRTSSKTRGPIAFKEGDPRISFLGLAEVVQVGVCRQTGLPVPLGVETPIEVLAGIEEGTRE